MNTAVEVGAAAIITRNIIQEIKLRYYMSPMTVTVLSVVINFLVLFAVGAVEAIDKGQPITFAWAKSFAAVIVSALYHDWKKLQA